MSRNLFTESSIWNCSAEDSEKFLRYCKKHIKEPRIRMGADGDLFIDEDFDRRHIRALLRFLGEASK